ncbi:TPA: hypothetical protein ACHJQ2_003656 [Escherichia coli]
MANPRSNAQMFDIDMSALTGLRDAVEATEHQMIMAYNRALNRTAKHMHRVSVSMIIDALGLKSRKVANKRTQQFIKRRDYSKEGAGDLSSVKLWYGLDDFRIHNLRGTMRQPRTGKQERDPETGQFLKKKKTVAGASFTPKSSSLSAMGWPDSFVATRFGYRSIWKQVNGGRNIEEMRIPVHEALEDAIDDYIYQNIGPAFMAYYEQDLRGRVAGSVHVNAKTGKRL